MIRHVLIGLMAAAVLAHSAAAAETPPIAARLAAASSENGEKIFKRCHACHSNEKDGPHVSGPNLWGIVGRPIASAEGFDKYSAALRATGGDWTPERLDAFLTDPHEDIHGTRMPFIGLEKPQARADLIAYLNLSSDSPLDLSVGTGAPEPEEPPEFGVLFAAEGVEETFAYCSACHSERLVAQQGLTRRAWIELIAWMVDEQGMAEIEEPDHSRVIDYLSTHYNTDRPNFPNR